MDQFLEHLVKVGIEKVIRVGGNSSCSALEGKNLRLVSQREGKTKGERYLVGSSHGQMEKQEVIINSRLRILRGLQNSNWANLDNHIRHKYPSVHTQFSQMDDEGFTRTGNLFKFWTTAKGERSQTLRAPLNQLNYILRTANSNVYCLALSDRKILLDHWVQEAKDEVINETLDEIEEDHNIKKQVQDVYDEVDRRVLETADVVGVTTSGLAKRISVLRHINAKVVICEEAGEVLEAHLLSALLPSVQHLIQIGDHQQLRPQINNFSLSLESQQGALYQLDRSQFERLSVGVHNQPPFPIAQLNVQRRMRPQISALIRNTLYKRLVDHEDTKNLPDVVGMKKNVFWFNHSNHEDNSHSEANQRSKSNAFEVEMTHALVRHIVRQGVYESKDIAVLTPYVGQLQKLRTAMRSDFEIILSERDEEKLIKDGFINPEASSIILQKKPMSELLRIATVDNFQGEEAKVVIVSLVRSNDDRKVGFLRTTNRINVLLSRAQNGMYLIGNAETYSNVPMWSQVLGMLRVDDSVGEAFGLCCPRHPKTEISVCNPEDFAILSPEGGCRASCDRYVDFF